jgi:type I restriction enzyme R subunit
VTTSERAFEEFVASWLTTAGGYAEVKFGNLPLADRDFDAARGMDTADLFAFIGATQGEAWERLVKRYGGDRDEAQRKFADRVAKQLDERGTVDVLRHGVVDQGVAFRLAFFEPAHGLTAELVERYGANRLNVTRQLGYEVSGTKTIDLGLFVNGLLVATAELKNPLTGQTVTDAVDQYRDRDAGNVSLARRAMVHFAVDTERVMMTTGLAGEQTRFLPFNLGSEGGQGNPANPEGHRSAYLWERVWQRDAWLDLLARFVHVEPAVKGSRARPVVIFPRLHQWDAVLRLEAAAREEGAGQRYLVQHSAGSGKSNTIAWLAHRLSTLHDAADVKVFDKVIVITDRVVLDSQLQDTIYQFEHTHGVVRKIDENSQQLADALVGEEARIIVSTLQKFPFVLDKIEHLPARRYAVIIDEAHSSQTGEAAKDLRLALGDASAEQSLGVAEVEDSGLVGEPVDPVEDALARTVAARGMPANLSFFAFTATPKAKTLELFGTRCTDGRFEAFHLYSMRQAIEEGFILDVLAKYTTYETFWHVEKAIADDPRYEAPKARRAIARFVRLHEHNLAQKAEIIVEHFRAHVAHKIGGHAKAMVVTASRLHAVRYKQALDRYIRDHGYGDIAVLVAFSGRVSDGGIDYSEANMNTFPESQTPTRFSSDDYQFLIVAEKYQTGFDQPLLYAMYVDKVLSGLAAVQTLSRLNRIHDDKDGTFVLDFRNTADDIERAFAPYYERTVATQTDPNLLYDTHQALDQFGILRPDEVEHVVALILTAREVVAHALIHAGLAPAIDRFAELDDDTQERFRDALDRYVRTYAFLAQLVSFGDTKLERDYVFCRALAPFIRRAASAALDLGREVELTHLRHEITSHGSIGPAGGAEISQVFDGGGPRRDPDEEPLSKIIETLNERYGLKLSEADRLHFDGIAASLIADETLQQQAAANTIENFGIQFEKRFADAVVRRLSESEDLTYRVLDNEDFRADVIAAYLPLIYGRARVANQQHCPINDLLARGEDAHLEYKSTLRWDLNLAQTSKVVESATIKTIAGFLNSREGGTLLIGVADDSTIVGLEPDYLTIHKDHKDDADLFQQALTQAILNSVGASAATNVTSQIHTIDGHDICRVHTQPSAHPVDATITTIDTNGQHAKKTLFYVRMNNTTRSIDDPDEKQKYIASRWGG